MIFGDVLKRNQGLHLLWSFQLKTTTCEVCSRRPDGKPTNPGGPFLSLMYNFHRQAMPFLSSLCISFLSSHPLDREWRYRGEKERGREATCHHLTLVGFLWSHLSLHLASFGFASEVREDEERDERE